MKRIGPVGIVVAVAFLAAATAASASTVKLCVPKREASAILTPKRGACKKGYKLTALGTQGKEGRAGAEGKAGATGKAGPEGKGGPEGKAGMSSGELETLKHILPHIRYVEAGVGGKATIQFSAVNVQVVNGAGQTSTVNGEGNLVIGYDENGGSHEQTGSHDLILGEEQTFTSFAGIVAGFANTIDREFASVSGGDHNTASGPYASISGGFGNTASGVSTSVSAGVSNTASEGGASVSGGNKNTASGIDAAVTGGKSNTASGRGSTVAAGTESTAEGEGASVGGGVKNLAGGKYASVAGGEGNKANTVVAWIGGGLGNETLSESLPGKEGKYVSIFGGKELKFATDYEAMP